MTMADLDIFSTILSLFWHPMSLNNTSSPKPPAQNIHSFFTSITLCTYLLQMIPKDILGIGQSNYLSQTYLPPKRSSGEKKAKLSAILSNLCPHKIQYLCNKKWDLHVFDIRCKQPRIILPIKRAQI